MPDGAVKETSVAVGSADFLTRDILLLASDTAKATKALGRKRPLTDYEVGQLEAAKHYIEIALSNDRYWKEGNVV